MMDILVYWIGDSALRAKVAEANSARIFSIPSGRQYQAPPLRECGDDVSILWETALDEANNNFKDYSFIQ